MKKVAWLWLIFMLQNRNLQNKGKDLRGELQTMDTPQSSAEIELVANECSHGFNRVMKIMHNVHWL